MGKWIDYFHLSSIFCNLLEDCAVSQYCYLLPIDPPWMFIGRIQSTKPTVILPKTLRPGQFIWRSGTRRFHLCVLDLQMSCQDFTTWQSTRMIGPAMAARWHAPLHEWNGHRHYIGFLYGFQNLPWPISSIRWTSSLEWRPQTTALCLCAIAMLMSRCFMSDMPSKWTQHHSVIILSKYSQ